MNEEGQEGPVHYQVSVTGRQASFFFLSVLASLGLAFFFGMKTGAAARKGAEPEAHPVVVAEVAAPTAPEPEALTVVEKERPTARPAPEKAAERPAEKPAKEPAEKRADKPMPSTPDAPAPSPTRVVAPTKAPVAAPEVRPTATEKAAPAKAAPAKPAAAKPAPAKAVPAKEGSPAPEPAKGKIWVQVTALSAEKADALASRLKEAGGFRTDVAPVPDKPGVFRVRVGPYPDKAKADAAVRRLVAEKWAKSPYVVKP